MRTVVSGSLLAVSLFTALPALAAVGSTAVDFENALGVESFVGVDTSSPPARNEGFAGFYWAWTGQGVVGPGQPVSDGLRLGNRETQEGFEYVGGSPPQFAYYSPRGPGNAYITAIDQPFDFDGAIFSSSGDGTLTILGQIKSGPGNGAGSYVDLPGAIAQVAFTGVPDDFKLETNVFKGVDRLVIFSRDALGAPSALQWALDDFMYTPVPEPSTWIMLLAGIALISVTWRRGSRPVTTGS